MATAELIRMWNHLNLAVDASAWPTAERLATELEDTLARLVRDRSTRGPQREIARRFQRDGLYAVGWQRYLSAPRSTRSALERFNATLRRLPGGVGIHHPV